MPNKYYLLKKLFSSFLFISIFVSNINATSTDISYDSVSEFIQNKKMKIVRFLNNPLTTKSNSVRFNANNSDEVSIEENNTSGIRKMHFRNRNTSKVFSNSSTSGEVIDLSSDGLLISTGLTGDDNTTIVGDQLWLAEDAKKAQKYDITLQLPLKINNAVFEQNLSITNHENNKTSFIIQNKAIVVNDNNNGNTYYNLVYKMNNYNVLMKTTENIDTQYQTSSILPPNNYTNWQNYLSASNGKINTNDVAGLYNINTMKKIGSLTCNTPSECSALDVPMYMNSNKTKLIFYTNITQQKKDNYYM